MKEKLKFVHKKKERRTENGLAQRPSVRLARFILRKQKWIEGIFAAGCIFSFIAMLFVNVNYDLTEYLPREAASRIGLDRMEEDFGYPGTARVMVKDVSLYEAKQYKDQIEAVDGVDQVLWCDAAVNIYAGEDFISMDEIEDYYKDRCAVMDITFDEGDTAKRTSHAVDEIRDLLGEKGCYTGMAVQNKSLKENIESEMQLIILVSVIMIFTVLCITTAAWSEPFLFLIVMGVAILLNQGTNIFLGTVSFLTNNVAMVLQLATSMDYSIFLWHSYEEQKSMYEDNKEAMAVAINNTLTSVVGSSITTVAGFIALCFMSYTLGLDLGIVMAKGVILGVIGCVTTLPSMILVLDKLLQKTSHKSLLPDMGKVASGITKVFPVFLILFLGLVLPSYLSYKATNNEVYYDLGETLPEDMAYVVANSKLQEDFGVGATHMVLVSTDVSDTDVRAMIHEMENVEGIKYALGLESVVGPLVPEEMLPESVKEVLKSDDWELLLVNSEYKTATDEVNAQINELNTILKKYDSKGMLIGEAPCTKDLIETTDEDFKVVNTVSIVAIFVIIALVEKSITLPLILVAVIELSIFINLGLAHLTGTSLPFIAPICISTIQLGATVDYAILMTTRYKQERYEGRDKREAVTNALKVSIPSIIVSAMGLFSATFGVALYSDVDIISSLCDLMARGAIVSMFAVILFLPAMFMLFDKMICVTSIGFRNKNAEPSNTLKERTA